MFTLSALPQGKIITQTIEILFNSGYSKCSSGYPNIDLCAEGKNKIYLIKVQEYSYIHLLDVSLFLGSIKQFQKNKNKKNIESILLINHPEQTSHEINALAKQRQVNILTLKEFKNNYKNN